MSGERIFVVEGCGYGDFGWGRGLLGLLGAWTGWAEADICVLRGVCIGLRRRISDWIVPFSHLFGVLFMAFGALGTRAAYRQMRVHLAVSCGCICASPIMTASHGLMALLVVRGVGLCTGRCR